MHYVLAIGVITLLLYMAFGKKALLPLFAVLALGAVLRGHWGLAILLAVGGVWFVQNILQNRASGRYGNSPASQHYGGAPPGQPHQPTLVSRFLTLYLNPESGTISAIPHNGPHKGNDCNTLPEEDLQILKTHYEQHDRESAAFLHAYLDQAFPAWRKHSGEETAENKQYNASAAEGVNAREAYAILGLAVDAAPGDIKKAHRVLMKKFHPDQGGAPVLAAKINMAKDRLT